MDCQSFWTMCKERKEMVLKRWRMVNNKGSLAFLCGQYTQQRKSQICSKNKRLLISFMGPWYLRAFTHLVLVFRRNGQHCSNLKISNIQFSFWIKTPLHVLVPTFSICGVSLLSPAPIRQIKIKGKDQPPTPQTIRRRKEAKMQARFTI